MKVSGDPIKQMVPVNSGMLMEMFTRDNGKTTKQMDTEFTSMLMEPNTKDIGKTIFRMALVLRAGQTAQNIKVATKKV